MKKIGRILALVLCLGLLMSLCFGLTASAAAGDSKAAEKKEDSPEGQYEIFAVHNEGFTVDSAAMGMVSTLKLEKGGKGVMTSDDLSMEIKSWTNEDGSLTFVMADGSETTGSYHDGLLQMMLPGYDDMYLFYAREDADRSGIEVLNREEFLERYNAAKEKPTSRISALCESLDTKKGVHLSYERKSEKGGAEEKFDVHGKEELYYSLHTVTVSGKEQQTANCVREGKVMLLYPKDKKGQVVTELNSSVLNHNLLLMDNLYSAISRRAKELQFTVETREIDGKTYEAEVFPATAFVGESVFCYDTDGKLVYYLEGETEVSAALIGKLSYTITAIDDKVDETLFNLSAYQLK